jgi:class 3 adenylate cyclase
VHRRFKELLNDAQGDVHLVFVVSVDVRAFSTFSLEVESVEAITYLKKVYARIISDYFPDASFFKSTGDGMLLVYHVDEANLGRQANELARQSRRLVADFPELLHDDPVLNFPMPRQLGIGLARGVAAALTAGDTVLDYSGKVLNLAARLTELARPEGVVIADSFGLHLLDDDLQAELTGDSIYVRSVAEDAAMAVHYDAALTSIPPRNRQSFKEPAWRNLEERHPLQELRARSPHYVIALPSAPLDRDHVCVDFVLPQAGTDGGCHESLGFLVRVLAFDVEQMPGRGWLVRLHMTDILDYVVAQQIEEHWPIRIGITYLPA